MISYAVNQPYIDSRAYNEANSTYVGFPSQSDAMLASLLLFHNVPCRIMDLILSVVTDPDFDPKDVTLRKSVDIIDTVEESRLKDRMAAVHERTRDHHGDDGHIEQAGFNFPRLVLNNVLDIIHAERMDDIRAQFEETLSIESMHTMRVKQDVTLKAMSLVHRSWTAPAQEALGRILYIGESTEDMDICLPPVRKSIFGPWTSVVAVQFFPQIRWVPEEDCKYLEIETVVDVDDFCGFENLHRILVGFTNLKSVFIKAYAEPFTTWSNLTFAEIVRRNINLEEVTLYSMTSRKTFDLSPLIEDSRRSEHLRSLNVRRATFTNVAPENLKAMQLEGPCFTRLSNVKITISFGSEHDLAILHVLSKQPNAHLKSLGIVYEYGLTYPYERFMRDFTDAQCAALFGKLSALRIEIELGSSQWLKWIGPFCPGLQSLTLSTTASPEPSPGILYQLPTAIQHLDLRLTSSEGVQRTDVEKINIWMMYLREVSSSRHFSRLKSLTFSLSREFIQYLESGGKYSQQEAQKVRNEMRVFEKEMEGLCRGAGVECNINLVS